MIRDVVSAGFGNGTFSGSIALVTTRGYNTGPISPGAISGHVSTTARISGHLSIEPRIAGELSTEGRIGGVLSSRKG